MQIGTQVLLKQGFKLVKAIVVDVDLTYITLKVEYKKGKHCNIKIKKNSSNIIKGIDVEAFVNRNNFMI